MCVARRTGNLAESNKDCTICFPVNIANVHWYGVVVSSDTNFLRVWESVGLDDGARELRIDFLLSVVEPFLRFIAEDFWNTQVGLSASTMTDCSIHVLSFFMSLCDLNNIFMSCLRW